MDTSGPNCFHHPIIESEMHKESLFFGTKINIKRVDLCIISDQKRITGLKKK